MITELILERYFFNNNQKDYGCRTGTGTIITN